MLKRTLTYTHAAAFAGLFVGLCAGCSGSKPEEAAEAPEEAAPVVAATQFAQAVPGAAPAKVPTVPMKGPGATATGTAAAGSAGAAGGDDEAFFPFESKYSLLQQAEVWWTDPKVGSGNLYVDVTPSGEVAMFGPLRSGVQGPDGKLAPVPKTFPLPVTIQWNDYRTGKRIIKAAVIESPDTVRITNDKPALGNGPFGAPSTLAPAPGGVVNAGPGAGEPGGATIPAQRPAAPPEELPRQVDATLELSGEVTEVVSSGKYLVLAIPSKREVAVVDVSAMKLHTTIPTMSDKFLIAASATRFVILDVKSRSLGRYSFETMKQEKRQNIAGAAPVAIALSEFGEGPIWVLDEMKKDADKPGLRILDLETFASAKLKADDVPDLVYSLKTVQEARSASAAATGELACFPASNMIPILLRNDDGTIKVVKEFTKASGKDIRWLPSGEGLVAHYSLITTEGQTLWKDQRTSAVAPYTAQGDCLTVSWTQVYTTRTEKNAAALVVGFHEPMNVKPRATLKLADLGNVSFDDSKRESSNVKGGEYRGAPFGRRFNYAPSEKVFSYVAGGPDRVFFKRFDVDSPDDPQPSGAPLAAAPAATATPSGTAAPIAATTVKLGDVPTRVPFTPGRPVELQLTDDPAGGAAKFELDSGPSGMTVSGEGRLSWAPAADAAKQQFAILGVAREGRPRALRVVHLHSGTIRTVVKKPDDMEDDERPDYIWRRRTEPDEFTAPWEPALAYRVRSRVGLIPPGARIEPVSTSPDAFVPPGAVKQVLPPGRDGTLTFLSAKDERIDATPVLGPHRLIKRRTSAGEPVSVTDVGLERSELEIPLPAQVRGVVSAGAGRYLLLSLPSVHRLAVFDVRAAKITSYIETAGEEFRVAGGLTRFVVFDPATRKLSRRHLETLAVEQVADLPPELGPVKALALSERREGPLYMVSHPQTGTGNRFLKAFDLATLKVTPLKINEDDVGNVLGSCKLAVSADGRTLTWDINRNSLYVMNVEKDVVRLLKQDRSQGEESRRLAFDGASYFDGEKRQYISGETRTTGDGLWIECGDDRSGDIWYAALYRKNYQVNPGFIQIQFYSGTSTDPLNQLNLAGGDLDEKSTLPLSTRLHYSGLEKSIALIGDYPPRVAVKRFDLPASLPKSPFDRLFITSSPPLSYPDQPKLSYQIAAYSKPGGLKYRVDSGPSDMTVSESGLVEWSAPSGAGRAEQGVVVTVTDAAGREALHSFRVPSSAAPRAVAAVPKPAAPAVPAPGAPAAPAPAAPAGAADETVQNLPGSPRETVGAGDGRYLLLSFPDLQKVAVFDVAAAKVARYVDVEAGRFLLAGGLTRFVVVHPDKKTLSRYNIETGEQELTTAYPGNNDGIARIAMGAASEGPLWMWDPGFFAGQETQLRSVDLQTLRVRPLEIFGGKSVYTFKNNGIISLSASGDGKNFCVVKASAPSYNGYSALFTSFGNTVAVIDQAMVSSEEAKISYDGGGVFRDNYYEFPGGGVNDYSIRVSTGGGSFSDTLWFSTKYYAGSKDPIKVVFHKGFDGKELATTEISDLGRYTSSNIGRYSWYSPREKSLVFLRNNPDQVIVKRFDAEAEIAKSNVPYLAFAYVPPYLVRPGSKLTHRIKAVSNDPMLTYKLVTGPPGMTVSPSGVLEWDVPRNAGDKIPVSVAVADSKGTEIFRNFRMNATHPVPVVASTDGKVDRDAESIAIPLPGPIDRLAVGGAGKYIVAAVGPQKSVVVVDVRERKIVQSIPLDDDYLRVAAGATKFVVFCGKTKQFHRYDFATFRREASQESERLFDDIALGSASEGPLVAASREFLSPPIDLTSLRPLSSAKPFNDRFYGADHVIASPDGRHFVIWKSDEVNGGAYDLLFDGERLHGGFNSRKSWHHQVPNANGSIVYTNELGYDRYGEVPPHDPTKNLSPSMPSVTGNYYVGWPGFAPDGGKFHPLTLHAGGDHVPLATLTRVPAPDFPKNALGDPLRNARMAFVPAAQAIVMVPATNDRLIVHRVDIEEQLKESKRDYVFAATLPPTGVVPGDEFTYRPEVKMRRGKVTTSFELKPDGMELAADGTIRWKVPASFKEPQKVIVNFKNEAGTEAKQAFTLEPVARPIVERLREVVKFEGKLQLLVAGGGGAQLIGYLPATKKLVVVDVAARKIAHEIAVEETPSIAAGAEKLFVCLPSKNLISRYDLKTGVREQTKPLVEVEGTIMGLQMGADSAGPLLVQLRHTAPVAREIKPNFVLLDPATLTPLKLKEEPAQSFGNQPNWLAAAGGRRFIAPRAGTVLGVVDGVLSLRFAEPAANEGCKISADGHYLYVGANYFNAKGDKLGLFAMPSQGAFFSAVPALRGPYVLLHDIRSPDSARSGQAKNPFQVHVPGITQPILVLPDIEEAIAERAYAPNSLPYDGRVFFAPHLSTVVTVPLSADRLVIHALDVEKELAARTDDYLVVLAPPPVEAATGKPWTHQLDIKSRRGGIACRLESGPAGLTVSPVGALSWPTPQASDDKPVVVVVSIRDASGRELLYDFRLQVPKSGPAWMLGITNGGAKPAGTAKPAATGAPAAAPAGTKAAVGPNKPRVWTSNDRKFTITAEFVALRDGKVALKTADGATIEVALDKLSAADQTIAKQLAEGK
jgi:hypothetical protein